MADEEEPAKEAQSKDNPKGMISKLLVWGIVFILGVTAGVGAAVLASPQADGNDVQVELVSRMDIPEADDQIDFIEFDEVVVNLNDASYSRYVTCKFSLQVAASQKMAIEALVEKKNAVLTNWMIAHLGDKALEDVRGKLGHNTLRREIHDKFNEMLFTDGIERIQDVLFQDFKVQ